MHDARLNKAESTVIIFMNEEDTLLRLILATLSQSVEFAQTSTPRSLTQMSNYSRPQAPSRMGGGALFFHREGIEDAVPSWMEWGGSP
jgi:hypothetical protein